MVFQILLMMTNVKIKSNLKTYYYLINIMFPFNKKQYDNRYLKQFPPFTKIPVVPITNNLNIEYDDEQSIFKKYIIVVQEIESTQEIRDIFDSLGICIFDKTYVEKYLIFSIGANEGMINDIKKYSWFVNMSRGSE
jgi:hypothetical protein